MIKNKNLEEAYHAYETLCDKYLEQRGWTKLEHASGREFWAKEINDQKYVLCTTCALEVEEYVENICPSDFDDESDPPHPGPRR